MMFALYLLTNDTEQMWPMEARGHNNEIRTTSPLLINNVQASVQTSVMQKVKLLKVKTKFYRHILSEDDNRILQYALDALQDWSKKWLLNLNINRCQVVLFGRSVDNSFKYTTRYCNNQTTPLQRGTQVLDLGVCFDERLSFKEHIHAKINKAYMMLAN